MVSQGPSAHLYVIGCTMWACVLKLHYGARVSTSLIWRDVAYALGCWSSSKNTTILCRPTQSLASAWCYKPTLILQKGFSMQSHGQQIFILKDFPCLLFLMTCSSVRAHNACCLLRRKNVGWKTHEGHWCLQAGLRQVESNVQLRASAVQEMQILTRGKHRHDSACLGLHTSLSYHCGDSMEEVYKGKLQGKHQT